MIRDGSASLFSHGLKDAFPPGTRVGLRERDGRLFVVETDGGTPVQEPRFWDDRDPLLAVDLPERAATTGAGNGTLFRMLLDGADGMEILPIRVEEHGPDLLGPRVIDELRRPSGARQRPEIVRHVVKGPAYEDWTAERLRELEEMLCSKPFRRDPLRALSEGEDWAAWKVRREILRRPLVGDQALCDALARSAFEGLGEDGSWAGSPLRTAYGLLHGLSLEMSPEEPGIQKAAQWLLGWPEPAGRPGMWMLSDGHLSQWDGARNEEGEGGRHTSFPLGSPDEDVRFVREDAQQRVMATCARHFSGLCDTMLHVSATAAYALCRCGHARHPRLGRYADSMLQLGAMFGYFCACWGILDFDREVEALGSGGPDFDLKADQRRTALKSLPYGYGRDADDIRFLAKFPQCPGVHRPDLADTNGWWPYEWRDIGLPGHFAVVGSYWQNADCWAKANRALTQFPGCRGSTAEFFALFQCHLYQTSLGEWNQGFPAGIFQWISDVTRCARAQSAVEESPLLRFAKLMILKTVPWLREHQEEDGLWNHAGLSRQGGGAGLPAVGPRLATCHIVAALNDFGLLDRLRPPA
jgi:hypothetical protein